MELVTVEKINWKEGEGAKGKWKKIGIITEEHGDKWFGCFENKFNATKLADIHKGSKIEVVTSQNGDFWNFEFPTKTDVVAQQNEELAARVARLEAAVFPPTITGTDIPYPTGAETGADSPDGF